MRSRRAGKRRASADSSVGGAAGGSRRSLRPVRGPAATFRTDWLVTVLVAALTLVAHAPNLGNGYVDWDDVEYVRENPHMVLPDGLRRIWTTLESPQYYPLTFTSYWLEYRVWGPQPRGYHATNLLLHALNVILVIRLLRALGLSAPTAWLAGALFGLHPVQVGTVAWMVQRKNTLSGLFALVAAVLYVRFVRKEGRWATFTGCLVAFAAALLSKTAVAPLPLSLLLAARWILGQRGWRPWLPVLPMLVLAAAAAGVTVLKESQTGDAAFPWPQRPLVAAVVPCFYLGKLLWPAVLLPVYPRWSVTLQSLWWWLPLVGGLVIVAAAYRWRRALGGATLWCGAHFVLMLLPVMHLVPFDYAFRSPVADHLVYLPALGLFVAVAYWLHRIARRWSLWTPLVWTAGVAVVFCGLKTWQQTQHWQSPRRLWAYTRARNPDSAAVQYHWSAVLSRSGELGAAIAPLRRAIELQWNYVEAHDDLGAVLEQLGRIDEALWHYRAAVALGPDYPPGQLHLGTLLGKLGRFDEAFPHCEKALELAPLSAEAHNSVGLLLEEKGYCEPEAQARDLADAALRHYQRAVALNPQFAEAHNNLGAILVPRGALERAMAHFRRAVEIRPGFVPAHSNLGFALRLAGQPDAAVVHFQTAVRLASDDLGALLELSGRFVAGGVSEAAIEATTKALELARATGQAQLASQLEQRLEQLQANVP